MTAKDLVADRACTSTVIRFCESAVVTDSAVSSEALRLLDFDPVVGVERFFDGKAKERTLSRQDKGCENPNFRKE